MKNNIEIIRAKHMGFCFGVMEAINICNSLKQEKAKKYILGMLVHNSFVVEHMTKNGFTIIEEQDLLNGKHSLQKEDIIVIRAHGTSLEIMNILEDIGLTIYDATCVFVSKIKEQVIKAGNDGKEILFVGDRNHPEVKGIISYAKNIQIFEDLNTAKSIKIDKNKKYFLSTQTTLNREQFNSIKTYFKQYENVEIFDKICGATSVRQKAVAELAPNVDIMFIVGDNRSSNTKKLYDISKSLNKESYLISSDADIDFRLLKNKQKIGITAGASTPDEIINNIETKIRGTLMPNQVENHDEFLAMLEDYLPNQEKRVEGVIEQLDRNYAYLDVPGERTAVRVRREEVEGYKEGDTIEVMIVGSYETDDDQEYILGSRKKIEMEQNWSKIEDSLNNKTVLDGVITKKVKGGYLAQALLFPGFLPQSLSDINENEEQVIGKQVKLIVKDIKIDNKKNKKITYSVKDVRLKDQSEDFAKLTVGDIVNVEVLEVLDFGLSVAIGTLRGFIHISEVSWKRLDTIKDMFKVGDKFDAKVISLDESKRNVKLSIKQLTTDPWENIKEKFSVGEELEGIVTKILNYGVFVEVAEGIEGLVHISDFSWTKKKINISEFVKVGDKVKVKLLDINTDTKKLKLGFKQLIENPWENAEEKFAVGKEYTGKIVELKQFGMFVEIVEGVDAFIHFSDYSWYRANEHKFAIGDKVTFKIIDFDEKIRKIKGSIKAMQKSPWEKAMEELKIGLTVERPIKSVMDFGIFIELFKGVDGFIPTQFASKDFIKNIKEKFSVGDVVKAQIVEINKETQKIKLSIKKIELENEKREQAELIEKYSTSGDE